ncbi:ATP-dependent DNA helicase RecG [Qipengyuania flava]|uniref:ATP-dependent DNA helicase RecG n=1 Tax=Qipengyuania flava TaxID=192812 RepID=UPI001C580E75|nr:ATP-dependent DNA helicase RecG [Qipengyuania flava]MBW3168187.1 ATP-dependent DNA helicase RecG [Qipengyuania flava]MBY5965425.1 ATP-dependent DNA helicase RecG [Qipengyuania flava]MBY6011749.1 ATP-dependent DNA helicase RecG [Qipengyuania flava]MBY6026191.1 ATP-dependent DNA helicase RecG [Qipengyuania flava]
MRPDILNPLFAETETLDGVGPKLKKPLDRLGLTRVRDLAYHLPERFVTRRAVDNADEAGEGEQIVIRLTVTEHRGGRSPRAPYRVLAQDTLGNVLALTYFGRASYTAKKQLPVGETRWVAGKLERFGDMLQIVHPDHVVEEGGDTLQRLCEPVYRLSEGLTQPRLAGLIAQALGKAPELPEWIEESQRSKHDWPSWREAIGQAHKADHRDARDRLAYDELLANSLALMLVRADNRKRKGQPLKGDGSYRSRLDLPFPLTGAQKRSIAEVESDMAQEAPMLRLLQGDVGAGKTVVALEAMLIAVEAGAQAALLAPTEILARQHFESLRRMAEPTGARVALLTGRDKGRAREATLMGLLDGSIDIVVGTHAIFQDKVAYRSLAMVVIDEQHRFGVGQRLMLASKGKRAPHVLAMTATPIPRTLTLAQYGELDVSKLDELPPGRQAIDTVVMGQDKLGALVERLAAQVAEGRQAYWVCPMVREMDGPEDIAAAEARYAALHERFGDDVVMVHGQLAGELKDAAMERFARGDAKLLVATTVIEVGVDVPNATLMVIEQAERFGLAQLHQLRGRVGRGSQKSFCVLLHGETLSETAQERLKLMRQTQDGFLLAEEDLRLRGGGELLGTRQSGDTPFTVASLEQITELLPKAYDDARLLMERDGGLEGKRGEAARVLLYLFERDFGVKTLRGG